MPRALLSDVGVTNVKWWWWKFKKVCIQSSTSYEILLKISQGGMCCFIQVIHKIRPITLISVVSSARENLPYTLMRAYFLQNSKTDHTNTTYVAQNVSVEIQSSSSLMSIVTGVRHWDFLIYFSLILHCHNRVLFKSSHHGTNLAAKLVWILPNHQILCRDEKMIPEVEKGYFINIRFVQLDEIDVFLIVILLRRFSNELNSLKITTSVLHSQWMKLEQLSSRNAWSFRVWISSQCYPLSVSIMVSLIQY